ncbi:hypothetical protein [Legionella pneumophila]|uniref:hypothetical protein n=1 Tax=Legionella pneumophila TaxID=446 RepID=UPI0005C42DC8|nr:hypothetical protein [Legionella pneumophila]GAN31305.1 hypothetical protein lpymt_02924 [Legionella pneumophila]
MNNLSHTQHLTIAQIQVYAAQADLDKLQQNLANIQSVEVQPNQTDSTTSPNQQSE